MLGVQQQTGGFMYKMQHASEYQCKLLA